MKKFRVLLSFLIIITLLATSFSGVASAVSVSNYTFSTITGGSISTNDASYQATVLVMGRDSCYNTESTLKNIKKGTWINSEDIRVLCADVDNASKDTVAAFAAEIDCDRITYCYGSGINSAMWYYLRCMGSSVSNVSLPVVVILDGNGNCQDVSCGMQSSDTILQKIATFADIDYTATDPKVSLSVTGYANYTWANQVVASVNETRTALGLSALKVDSSLMQAAMQRAAELSIYYSHTRPDETPCYTVSDRGTARAENIAIGYPTVDAVMNGWLNSSGHYQNIVNANKTSIGVGCFMDNTGKYHWVQFFDNAAADNVSKTGSIQQTFSVTAKSSFLTLFTNGDVTLNGSNTATMTVYSTNFSLNWSYTGLSASDFNFSSSDTAIATVDASGLVTMHKVGTATVTAVHKQNPQLTVSQKFTLAAPAVKLTAPEVSAVNTTAGMSVTWSKVTKATKYTLYRKQYKNGAWSDWMFFKTTSSTFCVDTSAKDGVSYRYGVSASNTSSSSDIASTATVKRLSNPVATVSNVTKGVKVSWEEISGAKKYTVYRKTYSSGSWGSWKAIKTTTDVTYTDTTAKSGVSYRYTVCAINGSSSSDITSTATIKRLSNPVVTVSNVTKGIKVSWKKISGAEKYTVYRRQYTDGAWGSWKAIKTTTAISYTDTAAKSGTYYQYRVRAVNGSYKSSYKTTDKLLRLSNPSAALSKTSDGIKVSWSKVSGAKKYTVYRKTYSNGSWSGWTAIKTTTAKSYLDTTAKKGVTYRYCVKAVNGDYKSSYSSSDNIKR